MDVLSRASSDELLRLVVGVTDAFSGAEYFEQAAQELTSRLFRRFPTSIVLARAYLTVRMRELPATNAAWVRNLAEAKGISSELTDETQVISLAGSSGRREPWNDRCTSQGHVGIPMTSASFIDAIPMMSRLMASLGGDLQWIDSRDASGMISRLGTVAGTFYVADAATETDTLGRKVISATDFVAENQVKTVFGLGGAFASGQLLVLLLFCDEFIGTEIVEAFRTPLLRFKSASARLLERAFVDGQAARNIIRAHPTQAEERSDAERGTRSAATLTELQAALDAKCREFEALNSVYLELESQLENRTRSLKLILDSTGDGMLVVDFDGTVYGQTTAIVPRWFGDLQPGQKIWDYLFAAGTEKAASFELSFSQLIEDVLPFELTADQMPRRLTHGGSTYELGYRQVFEKEVLARVLVVIRDVTAAVAGELAMAHARELHAVVENLLRDSRDFRRFVDDADHLLDRIGATSDLAAQLRDLHTLKGNTALYGFHSFATHVHAAESELDQNRAALDQARVEDLRRRWRQALSIVGDLMRTDDVMPIEISRAEHEDFLKRLAQGDETRRLAHIARSWRDEPTANLLRRLGAQAQRFAERMGKQVEVEIEDCGTRVPLEVTQRYWTSLVHAIRNALDHGIEPHDVRIKNGKNPVGRIKLTCAIANDQLVVSITDDGRGFDWEHIGARAHAAGLAHTSREDLVDALLMGKVSTREQSSEVSGRGVGISSLREACRELDGDVQIESTPGAGSVVSARAALRRLSPPTLAPRP